MFAQYLMYLNWARINVYHCTIVIAHACMVGARCRGSHAMKRENADPFHDLQMFKRSAPTASFNVALRERKLLLLSGAAA